MSSIVNPTTDAGELVSGTLIPSRGGTGVSNADASTLTLGAAVSITGGGTLALGGFTLTVPATGTAALLAVSNLFTTRQDIRASGVGWSDGLYVPWQSGDATGPTIYVGSSSSSNNRTGIKIETNNGKGIDVRSYNETAVYAQGLYGLDLTTFGGQPLSMLARTTVGGGTTKIMSSFLQLTSGTAGAGFGQLWENKMYSSTGDMRAAAEWHTIWATATDATRSADQIFYSYYTTTAHECLRLRGASGGAAIGFLGATPTIREAVAANATDLASVIALANDLKAKLITKGLIS